MVSSGELEEDVFLDSVDHLSSNVSVASLEDLESRDVEYEIWMKEPLSVKERRQSFLETMELVEFTSKEEAKRLNSIKNVGIDRISDCSMSVSASGASSCDETCSISADPLERNQDDRSALCFNHEPMLLHPNIGFDQRETQTNVGDCVNPKFSKRKWKTLRKCFSVKQRGVFKIEESKQNIEAPTFKVRNYKKSFKEFSALSLGQEIQAHTGLIWAMKFSPDNEFLATGGEDGIVCIWRVISTAASCKYFNVEDNRRKLIGVNSSYDKKGLRQASILIPKSVFQLEELPVHKFYGHTGDVLDLAWSNSNCLLSASMDRTVRLWQLGCNHCVHVFHHEDYVTCVQFNPSDGNCFISGSIDGKVRVWGVSQRRVIDWVDVRNIITAICYNPDGKGFVVGSVTGTCHFYESSGNDIQLNTRINIPAKKKMSGNKITGIQFSKNNSQRVMITSDDSKIRIYDGFNVFCKYKGLSYSGTQISASFASSGKHILSVGDDSCIYIWNYDDSTLPSSARPKSVRSCEYFFCEGVSVTASWSGIKTDMGELHDSLRDKLKMQNQVRAAARVKDTGQFSFSSWFLMDGTCRGSLTWPEEKLPPWDVSLEKSVSEAWGLVILTASLDGKIRTFPNYGLPVGL